MPSGRFGVRVPRWQRVSDEELAPIWELGREHDRATTPEERARIISKINALREQIYARHTSRAAFYGEGK